MTTLSRGDTMIYKPNSPFVHSFDLSEETAAFVPDRASGIEFEGVRYTIKRRLTLKDGITRLWVEPRN